MEIVAKLDLINLEINENSPEIILKSNLIEDNLPTATQSRLLEIIKSSLLSTNSKTLKYSIFLLQKIIEKENLIEKFTQTDNHWNNFFLMVMLAFEFSLKPFKNSNCIWFCRN